MDQIFDIVIIGGGIGGWTAARRAQQLGITNIALLERSPNGPGVSNSLLSGGRFHAAYYNPLTAHPDVLFEAMTKKTSGTARPDIVRAWADNTGRATQFLIDEGAVFTALGEPEYMQVILDGVWDRDPYIPWKGTGPERLLETLWKSYIDAGGQMFTSCRAVDLELDGDAVVGVHAEFPDGRRELFRGKKIVMADGGFQANRELVNKYVTRHSYRPLGSEYDVGDCLLMGMRLGAQTTNLDGIYATISVRDSITNERLRLLGAPIRLMQAGVVVDALGKRVGDEAIGTEEWAIVDVRPATWAQKAESPDCWVVIDDAAWTGIATIDEGAQNKYGYHLAYNPTLIESGATFVTADTLEELAEKIGMPPQNLAETVEGLNRFIADGTPIDPPRGNVPEPMVNGPFHAFPLAIAIYFTMGGLVVDASGRVLKEGDEPIQNLYAVGGTMGGLQGGPLNGYSGGWTEASTFGLLAAEHIAEQRGA